MDLDQIEKIVMANRQDKADTRDMLEAAEAIITVQDRLMFLRREIKRPSRGPRHIIKATLTIGSEEPREVNVDPIEAVKLKRYFDGAKWRTESGR